ncbi:MAG: type IV secretion system protein [Wolbachia sp.]|nr:type IV secretion system protein [Wolbachia sp.]
MQSHLSKCWFRLLLFAAYIFIIGCDKNDIPFPRCISADYFGPKPVAVSAHFPSDHNAFIPDNSNPDPFNYEINDFNYGFHHNQVVKWKDTGFETNGDSLIVRVNGAWTSWSSNNSRESKSNFDLKSLEQIKYEAKFQGKDENSLPDFHLVCNDYKNVQQKTCDSASTSNNSNCKYISEDNSGVVASRGAPCWFTNGHGAYLLFKRPGDPNPNNDLKSMRNPASPTIHLGYKAEAEGEGGVFTLKKDDAQKLKDRKCDPLTLKAGWKIYVKILDGYYLDNAGGYSFEFLSGVRTPNSFGFFNDTYEYLKCTLLINQDKVCKNHDSDWTAAAQTMFINIAEKSASFHNFVLSLLVLFIVSSSLLFLFGMIQETKHDLLIRMIKITLVVVLISPGSFRFFYDHFLVLFVQGLEHLINIVTRFTPNINIESASNLAKDGENARVTLFSFIEDMFNKFFAYSVWKKIAALFNYHPWLSILMVPAIIIGICLYFILCVYAFIIFLSGFMGIAFLIAIMPLFLISILFLQLKSLFDGWLKFCISFCLQSVMIFALLSLLGSIVMDTFYRQLGFTVCYNKWLEIRWCVPKWVFGGFCAVPNILFDGQFFGWTPGQIFMPYISGEASYYDISSIVDGVTRDGGTVKFTGGAGYIPIPPGYKCKGFRYIDFPFFNPFPPEYGEGKTCSDNSHYIAESDIIVDNDCKEKDLVRLTNSLLHASEKSDALLLMNNIDEKIGLGKKIEEFYCKLQEDAKKCNNYKEVIGDYKKGNIRPDLKNEIKSLVEAVVKSNGCKLPEFREVNQNPQDNSDYQRVQNIKAGYLINAGEITILFLLSFLMFSLCKLVQQISSSIAGGGFSVYNISEMYRGGGILSQIKIKGMSVKDILLIGKHLYQDKVGVGLEKVGIFITRLPNWIAGGLATALGRIPGVGKVLKPMINTSRKLVGTTIEATKFATSPGGNVDKLESKIYRAFGVDKEDIAHRRISKQLDYWKGYAGSHLGYTMKDAAKFNWEHGIDSIGKEGYKKDLLYRAKSHRYAFLEKLHDYTIGREREPQKYKVVSSNNQQGESLRGNDGKSNESVRRGSGTEEMINMVGEGDDDNEN